MPSKGKAPDLKTFISKFVKLTAAHGIDKKFNIALVMKAKDAEPEVEDRYMVAHKDRIPGGLADKSKPSDFDPKQLKMGIEVEREHAGRNTARAREIAMDHLKENPRYYSVLKKIHKEGETFFGDLTEAWDELQESARKTKRRAFRKTRKAKDMEEYGSPGHVAAQGGISDPGHYPPTIGFPSS